MTKLEQEVLNIINTIVEGVYVGDLKVEETQYKNSTCSDVYNLEYSLYLYLNADYEPMVLSYMYRTIEHNKCVLLETPEDYKEKAIDAFKDFIIEEFRNRMLQQVDYYKINLQLPSLE